MRSPSPKRRHERPKRSPLSFAHLVVWVLLVAPMCLAMQCYNEDLTQAFSLHVQQDDTPEQIQIDFPFTGRLSIDYSVQSSQGGTVQLRAQAQTSGDPDVEGCDAVRTGRLRTVDASVWSGTGAPMNRNIRYTAIDNLSTRTLVNIPYNDTLDAYTGALEMATDNTLVRLYTTVPETSLWDLNGNIVPPFRDTQKATCDGIYLTIYEIPAQRTRLSFRSTRASMEMVVLEDCAAHRIVENICPGSYENEIKETIDVPNDEAWVGHHPEVGVGDTLLVEATCKEGACPADVTLYGRIETLDCHTTNDCGGGTVCTHNGYCVHESPPSCSSTFSSSTVRWMGLLSVLILLISRRRRAGAPCAF